MVCCPRRATVRMPLSSLPSYEDSKRRLLQANRYGDGASVIWPFLRPALPDARPLAMVLTRTALQEASFWGVLDLRRVAHPPFRTLQTIPLPQTINLGILLDVLHSEFAFLPPLQHVFLDSELLDDTPRTVHNGILVTPASLAHTAHRPLIPAVDLNVDLLERRPGYRVWYNTFEPLDLKGRPSTGPAPSSSSSRSAKITQIPVPPLFRTGLSLLSRTSCQSLWTVLLKDPPLLLQPRLVFMNFGIRSVEWSQPGRYPTLLFVCFLQPEVCRPVLSGSAIMPTSMSFSPGPCTTPSSISRWPSDPACSSTLDPTPGARMLMFCSPQFAGKVGPLLLFG